MEADAMERTGEASPLAGLEAVALVVVAFVVLYCVLNAPSWLMICWWRWRDRRTPS
jgi:uncharacterized membrane protein YhaH (DUF805 family)